MKHNFSVVESLNALNLMWAKTIVWQAFFLEVRVSGKTSSCYKLRYLVSIAAALVSAYIKLNQFLAFDCLHFTKQGYRTEKLMSFGNSRVCNLMKPWHWLSFKVITSYYSLLLFIFHYQSITKPNNHIHPSSVNASQFGPAKCVCFQHVLYEALPKRSWCSTYGWTG